MTALLAWLRLNWLLVGIILAIGLAFIFLRTSPTAGVDSLAQLDFALSTGQPVVVEFYSNF